MILSIDKKIILMYIYKRYKLKGNFMASIILTACFTFFFSLSFYFGFKFFWRGKAATVSRIGHI